MLSSAARAHIKDKQQPEMEGLGAMVPENKMRAFIASDERDACRCNLEKGPPSLGKAASKVAGAWRDSRWQSPGLFGRVSAVCQGFTIWPRADSSSITTRDRQHREHQTLAVALLGLKRSLKLRFADCQF